MDSHLLTTLRFADTVRRSATHNRMPFSSQCHVSSDAPRETYLASPAQNHASSFPVTALDADSRLSDTLFETLAPDDESPPDPNEPRHNPSPQESCHSPSWVCSSDSHTHFMSSDGRSSGYEAASPNQSLDLPKLPSSAPAKSSTVVLPSSRPNSGPQPISVPSPVDSRTNPFWPDRNSSASLPLPSLTPFTSLPSPSITTVRDYLDRNVSPNLGPSSAIDPTESVPRPEQPLPSPQHSDLDPLLHTPLPLTTTISMPPPAPPTILTPSATPPPYGSGGSERPRLPYEPFLSNAPASDDCWIAIETLPSTYVLIVRLPGFRRDGM